MPQAQDGDSSGATGATGTSGAGAGSAGDTAALRQEGKQAAERGDYEAAEELFARAVEADPDDARARYDLALARYNLGDPDGAITGYLRAIQLDPTLIDAYRNLGILFGEMGWYEDAAGVFQQALARDPNSDALHINLGDTYRELGFYDDAVHEYRQAEILNPNNTLAADNLRDLRQRLSDRAEHIHDLERRVDSDPRDLGRYADLANAYLEAHRDQDALHTVRQMEALAPEAPLTNEMRATVFEALDQPEEAVEAWERVTQLEPENAEAWEHLGTWLDELGRGDEAITAYRREVELAPDAAEARFSLASALRDAKQYDEAVSAYRGLIDDYAGRIGDEDETTLADAYVELIETLNRAGRYDQALVTAEECLAKFPDEAEAVYGKATALEGLMRHDEAITAYEQARRDDPLNPYIANDLADAYREVGRLQEAIDLAQLAVALEPTLYEAHMTLAQALEAAGRTEQAQAALAEAARVKAEQQSGTE